MCQSASLCWCWSSSRAKGRPGLFLPWFLPQFQARLAGTTVAWLGTTAAPLQQVAWRKVLTRLQTVGLSMQGQSTPNSFRDTQMDLRALTHTWPECAVWPKWGVQTPRHSDQSSAYHLRSLMLPIIEMGFLAGSLQFCLLPSPSHYIRCPYLPLTLPYCS